MVARSHGRETSELSAGRRMETLTDCDWTAPRMPVPFLPAPPINLLASRLARETLLPVDSARRVSADLHKCSLGAAVSEKVQPKMRPYKYCRISQRVTC